MENRRFFLRGRWVVPARDVTAYMTWYAATWAAGHGRNSSRLLEAALERNLETDEPRLALMMCE